MNKILSDKKIYNIVIAVLGIMALVSLIQGCRNAIEVSQDFQWDAVKTLLLKINPYDESLNPSGILDQYGFDKYYLQMEANQFPSLLLILSPYTLLSPLTARYAWLVTNLCLTVAMVYLLRKTFLKDIDIKEFTILVLLMIAGTPYRNQLGVGQHTIFAFTFFLLAVYISEYSLFFKENLDKKIAILKEILVIICLSICYFKYTLTVPLVLYFIYKKRYIEIAVSVVIHICLTAFSAAWLNDSFLNMIIKPLKVSSNLSAEGGLDISALFKGSIIAYILLLVIMVGLFVLSLKLREGFDCSLISILALWSLIVTYHRTYDFFVMIIAICAIYELKAMDIFKIEKNMKSLASINRYFYCVLIAVFFVLRVFSENMFSKIIVGTMYYTLTFMITGVVVYSGFCKTDNKEAKTIDN